MALEINASKVVNTVTFKVDNPALNEAKKAIKSVKDYAEGLQPSLNMNKFKRQMREMEQYAKRARKAAQDAAKAGGAPPVPPIPPSGGGNGRGGGGGRGPGRGGSGNTGNRAATAALRRENFNYRTAQFTGASDQLRSQSLKIVNDTIAAYEREEISVSRLNQTLAHQMDTLRRAHREKMAQMQEEIAQRRRQAAQDEAATRREERDAKRLAALRERAARREAELRQRERERRMDRFREGALSLSPGMLAGGLIGAAALEGIGRVRDNLSETAERNNLVGYGARNVQANPNAILAMSTWGQQNGVDSANIKKAIDNLKDVRERLGNTAMNSVLDPKTGKYKGGDSGINDIMNQFGWTPDMIKKYQNNPLDFVGATVNEGQRRGMNSAQIGRLMENLGDDLMHYLPMFVDSGKQFKATVDDLVRTGAALSDAQIDAAHRYTVMAGELSLVSDGWSNKFLDGFMSGIDPETIKNFQDALVKLGPNIESLGHAIGGTIAELMRLTTWTIDFLNGPAAQASAQADKKVGEQMSQLPAGSEAQTAVGMSYPGQWLYNLLFPEQNSTPLSSMPLSVPGGGYSPSSMIPGVAYQQGSVMNLSPQIILPSDLFSVTVNPSPTFGDIIEATMDQKVAFNHQSLILNMNSSTSATGNN